MRTLGVFLLILILVLASGTHLLPVSAGGNGPDVGVQVPFELEAVTVSTKRLRSDEWKRIAGWIPYIGMLFSLSGQEIVIQHERAVDGTFLGLPAKGRLIVLQSIKVSPMSPMPSGQWAPSQLTLELPNGTLAMRATSSAGAYWFESDPQKSTGVFSGLVARAEVRIFGISDQNSILRGRVVLGLGSMEEAIRVLSTGLSAGDAAQVARGLEGGRVVLMPFPAAAKPPQETLVRWMVVARNGENISVQVLVLIGGLASSPEAKKMRRLKVTAIPTGGKAVVVYEKEHEPGDQVELLVTGAPPVVVLVYVDTEMVRQFKAE